MKCRNICNSSLISVDIMYCLNHQCQLTHLELGVIVQRDSSSKNDIFCHSCPRVILHDFQA